MSKPYRKQKSTSQPRIESYDALKIQLEQETQNLLRYGGEPIPSQTPITEQSRMHEESYSTLPKTNNPYHEEERKKQIREKIEEVISMCQQEREGEEETTGYAPIAEAEKQILDYLSTEQRLKLPPNPSSQLSPQQVSESKPHTFQAKSQKSSIREHFKQNVLMGDDAMEMIQEIERKALIEIESLRADKIELMRTLNEEIKQHNEEKKRSMTLEAEVRYLKEELARYAKERKIPPIPTHVPQQAVSQTISRKPSEHMPPMDPSSPPPKREHEIGLESQIQRLEEENVYLKQMMNQPSQGFQYFYPQQSHPAAHSTQMQESHPPPYQPQTSYHPSNNEQLKAELTSLEGKVRNYETVMRAYETGKGSELDYLLAEGHEISEQGKKLLRIKSKPEIGKGRRDSDAEEKEKQQYFAELKHLKKKISSLEEENQYLQYRSKQPESPPHKYILSSRQNRSPTDPTYSHKPTTSQYERVINQMKKVSHV